MENFILCAIFCSTRSSDTLGDSRNKFIYRNTAKYFFFLKRKFDTSCWNRFAIEFFKVVHSDYNICVEGNTDDKSKGWLLGNFSKQTSNKL